MNGFGLVWQARYTSFMNSRKLQIPLILVIFLVAIAIVNGFANANHWYWTMRWLDMPMHFAGGVWLAWFGVWWKYARQGVPIQKFGALLGVCLVFAISIGLLWEVYEAAVSFFTVGEMNAISDTISDILFDILGGIAVAVSVWLMAKLKTTQTL